MHNSIFINYHWPRLINDVKMLVYIPNELRNVNKLNFTVVLQQNARHVSTYFLNVTL